MHRKNDIAYFGATNGRVPHRVFGIKFEDRFAHLYVIGKTGTGKTTLLETLIRQDIAVGRGCAVIDPHGDLAERLVAGVPPARKPDLIYLDAADMTQPYGYNPLRRVRRDKVPLAVSGLMEALRKLWGDASWGVRMEHIFRNALYALIEFGDATFPDVLRILDDQSFRRRVLEGITNDQVKHFWTKEYKDYNPRYRQEAIAPIQNKVGAFLADPRLHRIFTSAPEDISFRRIMDEGKILVVNLAKGRLGEDSANLLGALLVTTIGLAAFSRAETEPEARRPFFVFIDEFQNFTTLAFANIVSELRKYRIGLTLAHQHLHQLEPDVRHAVLGNVGSLVAFRMGPEDARFFAHEFAPVFTDGDITNLPNRNVYVKLMIDGAPSRPFSATTLSPGSICDMRFPPS